jgi:hypothetical protein
VQLGFHLQFDLSVIHPGAIKTLNGSFSSILAILGISQGMARLCKVHSEASNVSKKIMDFNQHIIHIHIVTRSFNKQLDSAKPHAELRFKGTGTPSQGLPFVTALQGETEHSARLC